MASIFIDYMGLTDKMNHREQFEFMKKIGKISQDEKFEDWIFKEENYPSKKETNDLVQ